MLLIKGQLLLKSRVYSGFQIQLLSIDARNFHIHRDTQHSAAMQTVNQVWFDPSGLIPVLSGAVILVPPWIKGLWWTSCSLYEFKLAAMVILLFKGFGLSRLHGLVHYYNWVLLHSVKIGLFEKGHWAIWFPPSLMCSPRDMLHFLVITTHPWSVFAESVDWLSVASWLFTWILLACESLPPASPPFFHPWNRPLMPALVWSLALCVSVCVPARVCFLIAVGWYRAALTTAHSPASCGADSCVSIGGATHLFQMAPITHTHTELWETWTRFPFSPPH